MEVDSLFDELSSKKFELAKFSCFDIEVASKLKSSQFHWDFVLKEVVSSTKTFTGNWIDVCA